jgi:hypothetical protein
MCAIYICQLCLSVHIHYMYDDCYQLAMTCHFKIRRKKNFITMHDYYYYDVLLTCIYISAMHFKMPNQNKIKQDV